MKLKTGAISIPSVFEPLSQRFTIHGAFFHFSFQRLFRNSPREIFRFATRQETALLKYPGEAKKGQFFIKIRSAPLIKTSGQFRKFSIKRRYKTLALEESSKSNSLTHLEEDETTRRHHRAITGGCFTLPGCSQGPPHALRVALPRPDVRMLLRMLIRSTFVPLRCV